MPSPRRCLASLRIPLLLAGLIGLPSSSPATCRDYDDLFGITGSYPLGGRCVVVAGSTAFVSGGQLRAFDISDPAQPAYLGQGGWGPIDMCISGNYAYTGYEGGYSVNDISDPAHIVEVGHVHLLPYQCWTPAVSGSALYFVNRFTRGLLVCDVSNPAAPSYPALLPLAGSNALRLSGSHIFIAAGTSGLYVVDVSSPFSPVLVATLDTPGTARDLAIQGSFAYLIDGEWLQVVDISNPLAPVLRGRCLAGPGGVVDVDGDLAVVTVGSEVRTCDISNPDAPRLVNFVGTTGGVFDATIAGGHLFAVTAGFLHVMPATHALEPAPITGSASVPDEADDIAMASGYAYLACDDAGLCVMDISNPSQPVIAGQYDTYGKARSVALHGNHACVADGVAGLAVIDVSDPAHPVLVGREPSMDARVVGCAEQHAYVADPTTLLRIVDVGNPAAPVLVNSIPATPSGGQIRSIRADGSRLYVAAGSYGLLIYDISDETAPALLGRYDSPGDVYGTAGTPPCLFVADGALGLRVIDITDPATPVEVADAYAPETLRDVALDGTRLFAAAGTAGLQVFDVSNPLAPFLLGSHTGADLALGLAVEDGEVCVASRAGGLLVFPRDCFLPAGGTTSVMHTFAGMPGATAVPNPFRAGTELRFGLAPVEGARLVIHDVRGRLVRDLSAELRSAEGAPRAWWDGRASDGSPVPAGIYFARLTAGGVSRTTRVLLVR